MKSVVILFLFVSLVAKGQQVPQDQLLNKTITLPSIQIEFKSVLDEITKQAGIYFSYTSDILDMVGKVILPKRTGKVGEILDRCLLNKNLKYIVRDGRIGIQQVETNTRPAPLVKSIKKKVKVLDERGVPLPGADIQQAGSGKYISTDASGEAMYSVKQPSLEQPRRLTITAPGYRTIDTIVIDTGVLSVQMQLKMKRTLDEVLVIGYGISPRRLSTGDIVKISGREFENYHTGNILAALSGRVPRLLITQTSGLPESYFKVQLDGQSSIGTRRGRLPYTDPLFVIDGVPFAPNNNSLQILGSGSALGTYGRSPMVFIDPNYIESIEVLKDADATAIFGSRGARGVVMITTKQGMPGSLKVTADIRYGIGAPTRMPGMMNTEQYLQMRREAFLNDSASPSLPADKDLLLYDSTRYINFKKELLSKLAKSKDAVFTFTGGTSNIQYFGGANFHKETTVFPGGSANNRSDLYLHLNYRSSNQKLTASVSSNYSNDRNDLITTDLSQSLLLPPNSPPLRNSENKTNWGDSNVAFKNPLAFLDQKYHSETENYLVSFQFNYQLSKKWHIKATLGYNSICTSETSVIPISSINPYSASPLLGTAFFGANSYKSFIAEPQIEYNDSIGCGRISVLVGNSLQRITNENSKIKASGYRTDENYSNTDGASHIIETGPPQSVYNYQGLFERINYNWKDKYIGNLTGRIDWSNRYGLTRTHRNFAALGVAWIFSKEAFLKNLDFLSFGKIRASYGVTGNDPIGDMQYFDGSGRRSAEDYLEQFSNGKLSAELTRKLNCGLELAFLQDRLCFNMTYFRNRNSNLLISPDTFTTAAGLPKLANWPVKLQNAGFDFTLRYETRSQSKFNWSMEMMLTIPRNKLLSFPGLANSPYANILQENQSLTFQQGYHYLGVDPQTGLYRFEDKNNDGLITYEKDFGAIGNLDPKVYGGLKYDMSYGNWNVGFFVEGRIQTGYNYLNSILVDATPGMAMLNQPVETLNRWQKPGDNAIYQQFTTGKNSKVVKANEQFMQSDGRYADASFLRGKNIYISTGLPPAWLSKLHVKKARIYVQANNAFTITRYRVLDPETQTFTTLPPLKTMLAGMQFSF